MIELAHSNTQKENRYQPVEMPQENISTYEAMLGRSTVLTGALPMGIQHFSSAQEAAVPAQDTQQNTLYGVSQGMPPCATEDRPQNNAASGFTPAAASDISSSVQIQTNSWKNLMSRNVGRSVLVSFLIGTQKTVVARGILAEVGNDYIVLYRIDDQSYMSADLYSIRFMEFIPDRN